MAGMFGGQMPDTGGDTAGMFGGQIPNMGGQMPGGFDPSQMPDMGGQMPEGFDPSQMPDMGGQMPGGFDPSQTFDEDTVTDTEADNTAEIPSVSDSDRPSFSGSFGGFGMGSSDVKLQYIDDNPDSYSNIFSNAKTDITDADKTRLIESLKRSAAAKVLRALLISMRLSATSWCITLWSTTTATPAV